MIMMLVSGGNQLSPSTSVKRLVGVVRFKTHTQLTATQDYAVTYYCAEICNVRS